MKEIIVLSGQSNYDLALQSQGTFDYFISFLSQNGVTKSDEIKVNYKYNPNLRNINSNFVLDFKFTGLCYATLSKIKNIEITPLLNNDGEALLNNDGEALFNNF